MLAIGAVQAGRFNGTGGVDALCSTTRLLGDKNFQVVAAAAVNWGRFYDGSSTEWETDVAWKSNKHFSISASYQRTDIRLSSGSFAIDEVVGRINFSVNPRLYRSVFGQWNNDENEILFNLRFTLIPKPGASFYFVLNQFGDTLDPRSGWRLNKTVAMVKFVWYFSTK